MKNIFMLLVACVAMVFVSCSKDDDNGNSPQEGVIIAVKDLTGDAYNAKDDSILLYVPIGKTVTVDWGDGTIEEYIGVAIEEDIEDYNIKLKHIYTINKSSVTIKLDGYITKLDCYNNHLTSLDVSDCTVLIDLGCIRNQLTSLDVSKNIALTELYCYENKLTILDVTKNTALTEFSCSWNQLTSLDVSRNTALTMLSCHENQLTSLDVTKNTALTEFSCVANRLTSLDVSKNTALTMMWCGENQFTAQAMNNIYEALPRVNGGSLSCNKLGDYSIAEQKGWTVY